MILLVSTIIILIPNKNNNVLAVDEVKLKNKVSKDNVFAMFLEQKQEDGTSTYVANESNNWPEEGYIFNKDKSGCMDSDGNKIEEEILTYDEVNHTATIKTGITAYCYLYFDLKPLLGGDYIIEKQPKGLQETPAVEGDMRRFQGLDVNNYICLKDGSTCDKSSDNMYRIIGITDHGKMKVIKEKSIGNRVWDNDIESDVTWNNSDLYKYLNNEWYPTLNQNIKNMIESTNWKYYTGSSANMSAKLMYETENAESVPTVLSNVGLMQLSDYYLSQNDDVNCYSTACTDTWMYRSGGVGESQWTMMYYGYYSGGHYYAWEVNWVGHAGQNGLNVMYIVRPVFYLKSDITIEGGDGSSTSPFTAKL